MSKKDEALKLALEALEVATTPLAKDRQEVLRAQAALRERLAQPWEKFCDTHCTAFDHDPNCKLAQPEQEFIKHEEGEDGWSEWVCPDPKSYLMKCCDCGLVHEAQFGVVRYKSETEREDCDMVDDPNLQAVFRMRRSEQWSPADTAYRPGGLAQPEQEPVAYWHSEFLKHNTTSDHRLMENAQGDLERIKLVQTGVGIGKPAQQQEPVAWETFALKFANGKQLSYEKPKDLPKYLDCRPLYTSPPASKPWVGLTDEQRHAYDYLGPDVYDAIIKTESKLREKNNG